MQHECTPYVGPHVIADDEGGGQPEPDQTLGATLISGQTCDGQICIHLEYVVNDKMTVRR
jgi:hypothetical protein